MLLYFYQISDEYIMPVEIHHVAAETQVDAVLSKACKKVRHFKMIFVYLL